MKHVDRWITTIIGALDKHTDEKARLSILEECGRACFGPNKRHAQKAHLAAAKGAALDEVLAILNSEKVGGGHLALGEDGRTILGRYDRCYCPLAREAGAALSPTFCECTCGWAKALFETVLGRPVEVELLETVRRGGSSCRFQVSLPG